MIIYKILYCVVWFQGMDSGYGDDEAYNVYDQLWRKGQLEIVNNIYRFFKNVDKEMYGGDLEIIMKFNRYICCLFRFFYFMGEEVEFYFIFFIFVYCGCT